MQIVWSSSAKICTEARFGVTHVTEVLIVAASHFHFHLPR
jgi:hypothetical protein